MHSVHIAPDVHEALRRAAFAGNTSIRAEVDRALRADPQLAQILEALREDER